MKRMMMILSEFQCDCCSKTMRRMTSLDVSCGQHQTKRHSWRHHQYLDQRQRHLDQLVDQLDQLLDQRQRHFDQFVDQLDWQLDQLVDQLDQR